MEESTDRSRESALKRFVSVKLATKKDAHFIQKLIGELADYQNLRSAFVATTKNLEETLFNLPPYQGPTTFVLESTLLDTALDCNSQASSGLPHQLLRTVPLGEVVPETVQRSSSPRREEGGSASELFSQEITLRHDVNDLHMDVYKSPGRDMNRVVVGFVLFFPNYSTLVAKAGYHVEDLYIREPYRGHGFGTILLKTVAQQALQRGAERLEWGVLNWDENAIKFYKGLGATVLPERHICRLSGVALKQCDQFLLLNMKSLQDNILCSSRST